VLQQIGHTNKLSLRFSASSRVGWLLSFAVRRRGIWAVAVPETPDGSASKRPPRTQPPPLLSWLLPVPIGLMFGTLILAPFGRSPGDPSGHMIGAGLGGVLGLAVALVQRVAFRAKPGAEPDQGRTETSFDS
jgi:hypothetical protein